MELAKAVLDAAWSKNGFNTRLLDVGRLVSYTDLFVILTGRSDRHVVAIADAIEAAMKERGQTPMGVEGRQAGTWVLLDYGSVVVHVFDQPTRDFYDLERLWSDATPVPVEEPAWVKEFERMEAGLDASWGP
ncbi:MAG: ribosome silencing factor [Deltaproteobacteria bacterium]|nr:ribosome silencing factor [Deltaproteobacteria bacterium]